MAGAVTRPNDGPGTTPGRSLAFSASEMSRMVDRMAHQILEKTGGGLGVTLMGIPTRGVPLAQRLAERMMAFETVDIPVGALDTTLYRDDLRRRAVRPLAETVEPAGGIEGRLIVLVDDVLCSGRTVRAALDALRELGRPRAVQLAVLVDRGHRELPIRADYVGKNIPTAPSQKVYVGLMETDNWDGIEIAAPPASAASTGADNPGHPLSAAPEATA